jgi:signal transduction histidine kinase
VIVARQQLWQYALSVGVGGSIIALVVGFLILWRGFRPLEKILNRVRDIGSRSLAVRLPQEPRPQELQALADTLNSMLERLDTEFKTRERFIASVSHDLRTPLTVIQGQIDVLLMQPVLGKDARQRLEMMAREVRRLSRMTNNLLLSAQLESIPTFTPGEVDLSQLLDEVAREVRVLAPNLELKISIPEIVVVSGDYDLLKQMVLNVVDNALKFTPERGTVSLGLFCDKEHAVIEVSDTGPGIPQQKLAQIGKPFLKGDSSTRSERGSTGLGLAIVTQIVNLHGGELIIQSQEVNGTRVAMRLPLPREDRV